MEELSSCYTMILIVIVMAIVIVVVHVVVIVVAVGVVSVHCLWMFMVLLNIRTAVAVMFDGAVVCDGDSGVIKSTSRVPNKSTS